MPRATHADVAQRAAAAFRPSNQVRIGAEVEWLVFHRADPTRLVPASQAAAVAAGPLPAGGTITIEPGGQVELGTLPASDVATLISAIETDAAVLSARFAAHDLTLVPLGLDPIRPARRTLDAPRYIAMEQYFATHSPAGIDMMTRTASLQLNIDFGPNPDRTWHLAHNLAPLLAATFANSPTANGVDFQPISRRQQIWAAIDRSRTQPVGDTPSTWHRYILDANVMLHHGEQGIQPSPDSHTFAESLASKHPPTQADLDLHLTTLFPPFRPRGYLEVRMIDALPRDGRAAAIAAVWALLTDSALEREAIEMCTTLINPWSVVTSDGLQDAAVRDTARSLLGLVADRLRKRNPQLAQACDRWTTHLAADTGPLTIDELLRTAEQ
jgi:glutamate--cysteine ligase